MDQTIRTQPPKRDLRALKTLVGVMAALIVLGTAVVIGTVIHRLYASPAAPSIITPAPASVQPLRLGAGEHIASITTAGSSIAVWVNGPAGDRLLILNPATGTGVVALSH